MTKKLSDGQRHLIRLISSEQCLDGWSPVSAPVFPLVQAIPDELVELQKVGEEGRGRVRLTPAGQGLIDAMEWLK